MKKAFNLKSIILILSLALVFTVGAISVFAEEESVSPDIEIYNVTYGDTFRLKVAVPEANVPEGKTVTVKVYSESPTEASTALDEFTLEKTYLTQFEANYYVGTANRSVAASALGTEFYMQAEYDEGGEAVKGEAVKYSIAEYLYEKLYLENYVSKTEEDGEDYVRKTFYEGILAFGTGAQKLFLDTAPEHCMDALSYCVVEDGTVNGKTALLSNPGTALTVTYTGGDSSLLYAWTYTSLEGGDIRELTVDGNKSLTLEAPQEAFKLTPVFKNPNLITFEDGALTVGGKANESGSLVFSNAPANGLTSGIVENPKDASDSVYRIVGTPNSNQHFRVGFASGTNTAGDTYTFEADMYISSYLADGTTKVTANTNFGYIDFRSENLYAVNLYSNANSDGINIKSNAKVDGAYPNVGSMPVDEWFTFKMVTKYYDNEGIATVDTYFYVNEREVGGQLGVTVFGSNGAISKDATALNIKLNSGCYVDMYLDNIIFTRTDSAAQ
ncbi:MAG: hypothetical protein IJ488_03125 [Clostridia bacterium]|nr:hypothetical protein [Clostridia bacterium]